MQSWPFHSNGTRQTWTTIDAAGFSDPVWGCVYDGHRLNGGMPLGALGTGYFTIEGNGRIGHCSIYNDFVPPRRLDREWLTCTIDGVHTVSLSAADIAYWGHYPVLDMVATLPRHQLSIGVRAVAPLILGNSAQSNMPAVVFELVLHNTSSHAQHVALRIDMPPPPHVEAAMLHSDTLTIVPQRPTVGTYSVTLAPQQQAQVRFAFAWYLPHWRDSGSEAHIHRYAQRYQHVQEVAHAAWRRFDALVAAVCGWQALIYAQGLAPWLADALIQSLYSLAKNSIWIARTRHDEWWDADGWFVHNESHTSCPITETVVCRMHGHFPILLFFPELEQSTLAGFRHFQIRDGEIPFTFGMGTSMREPRYHCQHPLNAGQYAQMIWRLYQRTGQRAILDDFYVSAKDAIRYQYSLDDDNDGLINEQAHVLPDQLWPANQFYDIWPWWGTSSYVAGIGMATLACGHALAQAYGDAAFADECAHRLQRAQPTFDAKLWTGSYYRLWADPTNQQGQGTHNDVSLANQLMAQWCVRIAGVADVLPSAHVDAALQTVARLNMAATAHGLVNGVTAAGERYDSREKRKTIFEAEADEQNDFAKQIFVAENLCAAMTFLYQGDRHTGLRIAERIYTAIACISCTPWKQYCLIDADSGLPVWGEDYYSNMVVWAIPMALAQQHVGTYAQSALVRAICASATITD
ncbi:MAG: hypothetical protein RL076_211 [Chloroflexota bacterium]|jgi:uncharacterized protein (DUF608 family)